MLVSGSPVKPKGCKNSTYHPQCYLTRQLLSMNTSGQTCLVCVGCLSNPKCDQMPAIKILDVFLSLTFDFDLRQMTGKYTAIQIVIGVCMSDCNLHHTLTKCSAVGGSMLT